MPYQTPFADLTFPDESGRPCTLTYRVILTDTPDRLAVIHLRHVNEGDQSPASSSIVRDQILNRILESDLKGVPVNAVPLGIEDAGIQSAFPLEVDIDDYMRRLERVTTRPAWLPRAFVSIELKMKHLNPGRPSPAKDQPSRSLEFTSAA